MQRLGIYPLSAEQVYHNSSVRYHCAHCRVRNLRHNKKQQTEFALAIGNDVEIHIRRHYILSMEPVTYYPPPPDTYELIAVDLVREDTLDPRVSESLPSFGFNFRVQHDVYMDEVYFARALACFAPYPVDSDKELDEIRAIQRIGLYGDDETFPFLKQVNCRRAVQNYLGRLDLIEYSIFEQNSVLEISEDSFTMNFEKNVPHYECSCPPLRLWLGESLSVYVYLQMEGYDSPLKIERTYRLAVDKDIFRVKGISKLFLLAIEFIIFEEVPEAYIPRLRSMGFHFYTCRNHDKLGAGQIWFTRALTCYHPSPMSVANLTHFKLCQAMEMYCGEHFTKLMPVLCPKTILDVLEAANVSTVHKLISIEEPKKEFWPRSRNHFAYHLYEHTESICNTCSKGDTFDVMNIFTTCQMKLPTLNINSELIRYVHLSCSEGEDALILRGKLEIVVLDLLLAETFSEEHVKFLPFLGFNVKLTFENPCSGHSGKPYYGRAQFGEFEEGERDINLTADEIIRRISMFTAPFFKTLTPVCCKKSMEEIVERVSVGDSYTATFIETEQFVYPERTLVEYMRIAHPVASPMECHTCVPLAQSCVYQMEKKLMFRHPQLNLEVEIVRYYNLISRDDPGFLELEIIDFLEKSKVSPKSVQFLHMFGFVCEARTRQVRPPEPDDYYCRSFRGKARKSAVRKVGSYFCLLNDLSMYGGRCFNTLEPVFCPQTVFVFMTRFGMKNVQVLNCTPLLSVDEYFGMSIEHSY